MRVTTLPYPGVGIRTNKLRRAGAKTLSEIERYPLLNAGRRHPDAANLRVFFEACSAAVAPLVKPKS